MQHAKQSSHMTTEDWQYLYDERAAIAEHDGRLNRKEAEALAWQDIKAQGCPPFFQRTIKRQLIPVGDN
jgi:hypothetical protein